MRIHTKVVMQWERDGSFTPIEEDGFDYEGPIAQCGGGGGQTQNTIQKSDPWAGQQPYLQYGFQQAQQNYQSSNPQYYPGQTVAGFNPTQQLAQGLSMQRALNGSPVTNSASNMLTNTENGAYLNSNPYLDGMFNSAADGVVRNFSQAVAPGIGSQFENAGRYGSGLYQNQMSQARQDLGKTLGNMASNIYGNNYQQERGRMMQGLWSAPALANQSWTDLQHLGGVGDAQQQLQQSLINADMQRWNFNQNQPAAKLAQYMGMIQGNYGNSSLTQVPIYHNRTTGALGGAATGATLGTEIYPGWGTAIGALLGGAAGYFAS